jgi:phage/plasmid-associated DNA primase
MLAGLVQSRLVFASEIPRDIDWPLLKTLAGGDSFRTKRLCARAHTLTIRAWLCLASNDEPRPPDGATANRTIIARWTKPDEPNPEIMAILGTPGPARDSFLRACLRWLVDGFQAFHRDGLLIPDCARAKEEPEGLCAWWDRSLEDGSILPGFTWTIVGDFAKHAAAWFQTRGEAAPNTKALGSILRSRLPAKRQTIDGKKSVFYRAKVRL